MTTTKRGSNTRKNVRKNETINAVVESASINNSLGVASSHDVRVLLDSGMANIEDVDLIDNLLNSAPDDTKVEDTKLYKKIVSAFTAPVFDADSRIAELYAAIISRKGSAALTPSVISAVANQVASEKRAFAAKNPAPSFSPALVIEWIKNNSASEFKTYTGVSIDSINPSDVRYYSRVFGCVSSSPLPDGASLADTVRAILSEKARFEAAKVAERQEWRDTLHARKDTRTAALGAFRSNMSKEEFVKYAAKCYDWAEREGSRLAASIAEAEIKLDALYLELFRLTDGLRGFTIETGAFEGVWCFPSRLPGRGVSADVRKLWNDCRKRAKDIETAKGLL